MTQETSKASEQVALGLTIPQLGVLLKLAHDPAVQLLLGGQETRLTEPEELELWQIIYNTRELVYQRKISVDI